MCGFATAAWRSEQLKVSIMLLVDAAGVRDSRTELSTAKCKQFMFSSQHIPLLPVMKSLTVIHYVKNARVNAQVFLVLHTVRDIVGFI